MYVFLKCRQLDELYVMSGAGSVWSGEIEDVLVKAECPVHSGSEVFDIIGVC